MTEVQARKISEIMKAQSGMKVYDNLRSWLLMQDVSITSDGHTSESWSAIWIHLRGLIEAQEADDNESIRWHSDRLLKVMVRAVTQSMEDLDD